MSEEKPVSRYRQCLTNKNFEMDTTLGSRQTPSRECIGSNIMLTVNMYDLSLRAGLQERSCLFYPRVRATAFIMATLFAQSTVARESSVAWFKIIFYADEKKRTNQRARSSPFVLVPRPPQSQRLIWSPLDNSMKAPAPQRPEEGMAAPSNRARFPNRRRWGGEEIRSCMPAASPTHLWGKNIFGW